MRLTACIKATAPLAVVTFALLGGCEVKPEFNGSIDEFLRSQPGRFATVTENPEQYRVQIIYTQIDRDENNHPSFTSYTYRLSEDEYFYPASTVKLPAAALALEKINTLDLDGLTRDTTMLVGDEKEGKSVARYTREVLLVSDNVAFNRLYDFLGQEGLNDSLRDKGFSATRIMHRLSIAMSVEENRRTGPVQFVDGDEVIAGFPEEYSSSDLTAPEPILLGEAEIIDGERHEGPKDFAIKNAYPLQAQHDVVKALMFPDVVGQEQRFGLSEDDYVFLYRNMSGYPTDSGIAEYSDPDDYPDGYVKFFLYGGDAPEIPENMRIFNKVGNAYGFLTDAAYVVDFEHGVEFLLAATVYTNANATFNDDQYEYDEIGSPFLRDLGLAIYEVELARERPNRPDLGRFRAR
jgi:hypothetical protein